MRKLIVVNIMSLDGYVEGEGKNFMAMPADNVFDEYNAERVEAADTLLLGATTYRMFSGFWPAVADNPEASAANRRISRRNNGVQKVVVSDSLTQGETGAWRDTTTIVRRDDAHAFLADLKRSEGGDIVVFGSAALWNDLLTAGLVDELHLMVGPVVIGGGTPAFSALPPNGLTLQGVRTFEQSGNVVLRY